MKKEVCYCCMTGGRNSEHFGLLKKINDFWFDPKNDCGMLCHITKEKIMKPWDADPPKECSYVTEHTIESAQEEK